MFLGPNGLYEDYQKFKIIRKLKLQLEGTLWIEFVN